MLEPNIMSVIEFRKHTGLASTDFSDEQVIEIIVRLDTLANIFIKQQAGAPKEQ